MKKQLLLALLSSILFLLCNLSFAQNPIIRDQFTADPSGRVFGDRVFVFPSHDVANMGKGRKDWFCMEDYHVFSSEDLIDWTDHGMIVSQETAEWVNPQGFSMWAPDCIEKNGKYYFYFPSGGIDSIYGRGFRIGAAVANNPEGPYVPQSKPIENARGIDPNVFIDNDGQGYLYWSGRGFWGGKLTDDMMELAEEPVMLKEFPVKGMKEGPYLFERDGKYYMTYPHVENKTERLEYAIGDSPLGPFEVMGVIMDESATGCWTNHHSIINFKDQWYLFYHHNDYSPNFDKNRSIRMDSLFFNEDGTIQKVIPTLRGVGVSQAVKEIQIDRYSKISENGASIELLDTINTFKGWKTNLNIAGAWIQYNAVNFETKPKWLQVKAISPAGGIIQIRLDKADGPLLSEIKIPKTTEWTIIEGSVSKKIITGKQNLVIVLKDDASVEIDWISFKK